MLKDSLTQISALCVGATALALGDPTAGVATWTAAGGLAAVVLGRRAELAEECDRVFARVQAAYRQDWERVPMPPDARREVDAVDALIRGAASECLLDKVALAEAAFDSEKFPARTTAMLLERLGITEGQGHHEIARGYAAGLIAAGLGAAMERETFYKGFRLELSLEQARRIGLLGEDVRALAEKIDDLIRSTSGPRELLENLVQRFQFKKPDAPLGELGDFLKAKAVEWEELKGQLAKLEEEDRRIAGARKAALAEMAAGNFDAADSILAGAEELQQEDRTLKEVRRQVRIRQARADALVLKGDADSASAHFEAAAGFLLPFAPTEAASVRHAAADRLCSQSLRFGGTGLLRAIELYRRNTGIWTQAGHPSDWAMTQVNLGGALAAQAKRTERAAGNELLGEAITVYRGVLEVRSRAHHPVDWAMMQNNLGNALHDQAGGSEGVAGAALLGAAVEAYRGALEVCTRADQPVHWAMITNNLGIALGDQARRTAGPASVALLDEAVKAFRGALEVRTLADHSADWAATQSNLANALKDQSRRTAGGAGVAGTVGNSVYGRA